jgi:hypothetical protein
MIAKIPSLLSAALVTAMAGQAAAHEGARAPAAHPAPAPSLYTPVGYRAGAHAHPPTPVPRGPEYGRRGYHGGDVEDLRQSDRNRDGVVTLAEALQEGRYEFRNSDRDRNRILTRREVSWGEFASNDRDRNGIVSYGEHQDSIRRAFHRLDTNRDGVLARYELGSAGARRAGWRR